MNKETVGMVGQYGCLVTMLGGLVYEIASGAYLGWILLTGGAIGAMVFTKIRGR